MSGVGFLPAQLKKQALPEIRGADAGGIESAKLCQSLVYFGLADVAPRNHCHVGGHIGCRARQVAVVVEISGYEYQRSQSVVVESEHTGLLDNNVEQGGRLLDRFGMPVGIVGRPIVGPELICRDVVFSGIVGELHLFSRFVEVILTDL